MSKPKKNRVSYVVCNKVINLSVDGESFTVDQSHLNYKTLLKELRGAKRPYLLKKWANAKVAVEKFLRGRVKVNVEKEEVLYKGTPVEPVITKKIIEFMNQGLDAKPLVRFLDKLMRNPSARAVNELYGFLEKNGLCLAPDGDFYSYKSVRPDYYDHYSNTFLNKPNKIIKMERNKVSDDCRKSCHDGLHIGVLNYAKNFHIGNQRIMLVKASPEDCVSVPADGSEKCRVCKYKVVREYTEEKPIQDALYLNDGVKYTG